MNEKEAIAIVEKTLPIKRFEHTLRVVDESEKLAKHYGVDVSKARMAAVLHDYAKYRSMDEMRETVKEVPDLPEDLLHCSGEILHAFVGAVYVKEELGISDKDILSAIQYHTTGRAKMSKLEKIIFLADYIEPGRKFPGLKKAQELAQEDLDEACLFALKNSIQYLLSEDLSIYRYTIEAYNDFIKITKGRL